MFSQTENIDPIQALVEGLSSIQSRLKHIAVWERQWICCSASIGNPLAFSWFWRQCCAEKAMVARLGCSFSARTVCVNCLGEILLPNIFCCRLPLLSRTLLFKLQMSFGRMQHPDSIFALHSSSCLIIKRKQSNNESLPLRNFAQSTARHKRRWIPRSRNLFLNTP